MRKLHILWTVVVVAALLLPTGALAQNDTPAPPPDVLQPVQGNPFNHDGGSLTFIPNVMKGEHKPWSAPEFKLLHAGMNQLRASTADAWCVNLLNTGVVLGASDYCLGGALYPSLVNKDSAVSAAGWQNGEALTVEGKPLNMTTPDVIHKRIILGNVIMEGGQLFEFGKDQKIGVLPIFFSNNVNAAGVEQQATGDEVELLERLNRMNADVAQRYGVPIPMDFPVYDFGGIHYSTLGGLCLAELDGESTWPWYFMDVILDQYSPILAGEWGLNTIDPNSWALRSCMLNYKFFRWEQLRDNPVFAPFREAVMNSPDLATPKIPLFRIQTWSDTEKGGDWYFQIVPVGGAIIVAAQYMQQLAGVLQPVANLANGTMAWLVVPSPDSNLLCGVFGDPNTCAIRSNQ